MRNTNSADTLAPGGQSVSCSPPPSLYSVLRGVLRQGSLRAGGLHTEIPHALPASLPTFRPVTLHRKDARRAEQGAPRHLSTVRGPWVTYPDQELRQDHVPLPAGQVQRRAAVPLSAGLVHLLPGAMRQQQDDSPQVLVGGGPQQVLAQGQLCAGQRCQEELLLVLGPDPPLLLFPARATTQARSPAGRTTGAETPFCSRTLVVRRPQGRNAIVGEECPHRAQGSPLRDMFPRLGSRPSSISTTWKLVRNADPQALPLTS